MNRGGHMLLKKIMLLTVLSVASCDLFAAQEPANGEGSIKEEYERFFQNPQYKGFFALSKKEQDDFIMHETINKFVLLKNDVLKTIPEPMKSTYLKSIEEIMQLLPKGRGSGPLIEKKISELRKYFLNQKGDNQELAPALKILKRM
jgi:hypothetical protein